MKRPTLAIIAETAGLSTSAVSQILRGKGSFAVHTRNVVHEVAKQLHYVPDQQAVSMRLGGSNDVGIILQDLSSPLNLAIVKSAKDKLAGEGLEVFVVDSENDPEQEYLRIRWLIQRSAKGVLWLPSSSPKKESCSLLAGHRFPTATLSSCSKLSMDFDCVNIQEHQAMAKAVEHLSILGHERIGFFCEDVSGGVFGRRPIEVYAEAVKSNGAGKAIVKFAGSNFDTARTNAQRLFDEHPDITALVCSGEFSSMGASTGLIDMGLMPGKDRSVVGFGSIATAQVMRPTPTLLSLDSNALGQLMASMLIDRLADRSAPPQYTEFPIEFLPGNSTGQPNIRM